MDNCVALLKLHQEHKASFPTYDGIKHLVADITGINPLIYDMCVNSCIASTGPFAANNKCPECLELRYDPHEPAHGHQTAHRTFHTYPLGPQLQAMYASVENAHLMHHHTECTHKIRTQLCDNPNSIRDLDNIY
ncbi:hypothetical protein C2E23DRAFT_739990 [Lenzites betulinus]|nr:hypothetical protein C2E23DRAFT_739990 [Lenzites betulinus]